VVPADRSLVTTKHAALSPPAPGRPLQKKSLTARERCKHKRAAFRAAIAEIPLEKLVFIDECGFSLDLHRKYGWVIGGGRCSEAVPVNTGKNRSVVGAYSWPSAANPTGLWTLWQKLESWNQRTFALFISDGLLPLLPAGSVLVMDNASIHKGQEIEALVAAAGCHVLYLPSYSPDFNPIEPVWSWLKHQVRMAKPENDSAREEAIFTAQKLLPPHAAPGWFTYAGLL
jgi:hypothetical protein